MKTVMRKGMKTTKIEKMKMGGKSGCPPGYTPTPSGGCKPMGAAQAIAAAGAGAKMVAGAVKTVATRSKAKKDLKELKKVTTPPMKKGGKKC
jgi:hypothetical protein